MERQTGNASQGRAARAYDFYGARDSDARQLSDRVAAAAGVTFTRHVSVDRGEYYLAVTELGSQIVVESNVASDEDGSFHKRPAAAAYEVLLLAWHKASTQATAEAPLDMLRERLAAVQELDFLHRRPGRGSAAAG